MSTSIAKTQAQQLTDKVLVLFTQHPDLSLGECSDCLQDHTREDVSAALGELYFTSKIKTVFGSVGSHGVAQCRFALEG